jgi:hypothetical protein
MRRWPWITLLLAAAVALNPIGLDFIHSAFFSNEQLSRNIAQPFVFIASAIAVVLGLLEWVVRWTISKRRVEH